MNNIEQLLQQILDSQNKINERLDKIELQTSESTQILKTIEHNSQINETEINNLIHTVVKLSRDIKLIKIAINEDEETYNYFADFNTLNTLKS